EQGDRDAERRDAQGLLEGDDTRHGQHDEDPAHPCHDAVDQVARGARAGVGPAQLADDRFERRHAGAVALTTVRRESPNRRRMGGRRNALTARAMAEMMSCMTMLACQYCQPARKPEGSAVPELLVAWTLMIGLRVEEQTTPPFRVGAQ